MRVLQRGDVARAPSPAGVFGQKADALLGTLAMLTRAGFMDDDLKGRGFSRAVLTRKNLGFSP